MRIALSFVIVAAVFVTLPAAAEEAEPTPSGTGTGAAVTPSSAHTLAQVHGRLTADGARAAGQSRDVVLSSAKPGAGENVARPAPTPRVLRRMATERAIATLEPTIRACAPLSTTAAPTTFGVRISVAPGGEVETADLASPARISPALVACVVHAVSSARFGAPGAAGVSIIVLVTVPGRVATSKAADSTTVTVSPPTHTEAKAADPVASH